MLPLYLSPTLSAASGFRGDEAFGLGRQARSRASQMKQRQGHLLLKSNRSAPPHRAPTMVSLLVEFCRRHRSTRSHATGASAQKAPIRAPEGLLGVMRLYAANTPACPSGDTREDIVWQVHRSVPAIPCKFTGSKQLCHVNLLSENLNISLNLENLNQLSCTIFCFKAYIEVLQVLVLIILFSFFLQKPTARLLTKISFYLIMKILFT